MSLSERGKSTTVLAVDTGGTFTDLLLLHNGTLTALKVPSTPEDPAEAVLSGASRILAGRTPPGLVLIHGSTVATNAILERKGARVLLVTNAGFEDVLEIGRQDRPQLYALSGSRPPPLVHRDDRIGIRGRMDSEGRELSPLDAEELSRLPGRLAAAESVALVLLHSYANPAHEEAVAEALVSLGIPLSVSSRILPEFREFERTSTTVANAFVAPRMARYLARLREAPTPGGIRIMGSTGGALPLARAISEPVHTVLSGPAGGVVGALEWGRRCGSDRILSFDMGGTSTDVSLIPGSLRHTREGVAGGIPISVPLLDIHTVGAGGGSIARVDPGGALRVGPESAGASPGPIAYGRGGTEVTVTDAHVWLGRLPPQARLGGTLRMDRDAVAGPLGALSTRAGISMDDLAEGILEVVDTSMERALRVISIERGVDPSDFHLLAFGGAGGLHAAELTDRMGLRGALIPPDPGLLSAFGMLVAPIVRDRSRTLFLREAPPGGEDPTPRILAELEAEAKEELVGEGVAAQSITVRRWIDARYEDQGFELRVGAEDWVEGFHRAHERRYGYRREAVPVEAVTLRVRAEAPGMPVPGHPRIHGEAASGSPDAPEASPEPGPPSTRVRWRGSFLETPVIRRVDLLPGRPIEGPALVLEYSSTTWCPPGWTLRLDDVGVMRLTARDSPPS